MKWIITVCFFFFTNLSVSQELIIHIKSIDTEFSIDSTEVLVVEVVFKNNTSKSIILPKTFDLEINLRDASGNVLHGNYSEVLEYQNLIILRKPLRIPKYDTRCLTIIDWRMSLYALEKDNKYKMKYILNTNQDSGLSKRLKEEVFETNCIEFLY